MPTRDKTRGRVYYPGGFVRQELRDYKRGVLLHRWLAYRAEVRGYTSALCDEAGEVLYFATEADAAAALTTAALSVSEYLKRKRGQ